MREKPESDEVSWGSGTVADFYAGETAGWKDVLGPGMHYAFGSVDPASPIDDAEAHFRFAVRQLYPWIPVRSRVLDVGCGWGGPARILVDERHCSVHGITISKTQASVFAERVPEARVSVMDAQELDLEPVRDDADVAIMLESLTHMPRPDLVLRRLRPHADLLLIRDHVSRGETGFTNPHWRMRFPSRAEVREQITEGGFHLKHEEVLEIPWEVSAAFWLENIRRAFPVFTPDGQFTLLRRLCEQIIHHGPPNTEIMLFVAE